MIQQVTQGIRISVNAFFEGTYFKNYRLHYSFGYRISISNHGKDTVQLQSRHWKIFDSLKPTAIVDGEGVVGKKTSY
jgi:ApaG protein